MLLFVLFMAALNLALVAGAGAGAAFILLWLRPDSFAGHTARSLGFVATSLVVHALLGALVLIVSFFSSGGGNTIPVCWTATMGSLVLFLVLGRFLSGSAALWAVAASLVLGLCAGLLVTRSDVDRGDFSGSMSAALLLPAGLMLLLGAGVRPGAPWGLVERALTLALAIAASMAMTRGAPALKARQERRELLRPLDEALAAAATTKTLDLSGRALDAAQLDRLAGLAQLEELNLAGLKLESIPPAVLRLGKLRALELGGNPLRDPAAELAKLAALPQLEKLGLANCGLSLLPPAIGALAALRELDVGSNQLGSLPAELGDLRNLTTLRLGANQLGKSASALPDPLGQLNLTYLDLSNNQLAALPGPVAHLAALQALDLGGNALVKLPALDALTDLRELAISQNPITGLSTSLRALHKLKLLRLDSAQLEPEEQKALHALFPAIEIQTT